MKRTREEIVKDIKFAEKSIDVFNRSISREKSTIHRTTIELDNYDIQEHQQLTLKQFPKWKEEFYQKHKYKYDLGVLKSLLDNLEVINWDVGCKLVNGTDHDIKLGVSYQTKVKMYYNNIHLNLGNKLHLKFNIGRTNCSPNPQELFIWQDEKHKLDLLREKTIGPFKKLSRSLELDIDLMFELIGFCFHVFSFSARTPHTRLYPYTSSCRDEWTKKILESYDNWRCDKNITFWDRYPSKYGYQDRKKRLKAQSDIPRWKFLPLYQEDNEDNEEEIDIIN